MRLLSRLFGPRGKARDMLPELVGMHMLGGYNRPLPRRGTRDLLSAYTRSPILQSIARKIAFSVATTRYYTTVNGEEVPGHILTNLVMRGPEGLSGLQALIVEELHLLIVGETFAVLDKNMAGLPFRRWPVPPTWVQEVPVDPHGTFRVTPESSGAILDLPRDRMLWLKEVDPLEPYERGAGVGRALSDELETDERAAQHMASTLANRAIPETIVSGSVDAPIDESTAERLKVMLEERFGGARNRGRTFVAKGPLNVESLTPNFGEMKLIDLRQDEREIMTQAFGIPPELIGRLNSSNRATIESAEYLFSKHVVEPRVISRVSAINDQIAPLFGDDVRLEYDSPVEEDREFKAQVMKSNPYAFMIDDVRELAGCDPLPDGAGQRFPQQMAISYAPYAPTEEPDGQTRAKAMTKATEEDVEEAVNALSDDAFSQELSEVHREVIAEFGEDAVQSIMAEIDFDLQNPRVHEFIRENAAERSSLITGTSRERLSEELSDGVRLGESTDKLVARIREAIGTEDNARARMISRTEITRGSNFATTEAHRQAGIDERQWLATQDSNVRDTHSFLDGAKVGIDEPFEIAGATAMYPGGFGVPALDINCRCGTTAVFPEDLSREQRVHMWKVMENKREPHERRLESRALAILRREAAAVERALLRRTGGE